MEESNLRLDGRDDLGGYPSISYATLISTLPVRGSTPISSGMLHRAIGLGGATNMRSSLLGSKPDTKKLMSVDDVDRLTMRKSFPNQWMGVMPRTHRAEQGP